MSDRVAEPTPVGRFLSMEIDDRGWTHAEFAAVLGRPVQFVSEIVNGKKEITRESAAQIGAALGQTAEFWLRFQDEFLLSEQSKNAKTQQDLSDVRRRSRLNELVPLAVLRKRGILHGQTLEELENEVAALLELPSIERDPAFEIAARRSNHDEPITLVQQAWAACVRGKARGVTVPPFSPGGLEDLAASLPTMLDRPLAYAPLPALFAEVGVILVYFEALPGAKIDGCSFMLDNTPVIALSGRGKRLDKVLWTLLHEIAHVALGHVSAQVIIEALDEETDRLHPDEVEEKADARAGEWLFPTPLTGIPDRVSTEWVGAQATSRDLAPIVIIGHLQKRRVLDWRTTLARNAPNVDHVLAAW
jgi:HTH-type transcriptional regulator/antitoxin HigA